MPSRSNFVFLMRPEKIQFITYTLRRNIFRQSVLTRVFQIKLIRVRTSDVERNTRHDRVRNVLNNNARFGLSNVHPRSNEIDSCTIVFNEKLD